MAEEQAPTAQQESQQQFMLQRVYAKDLSFESPKGVDAFKQQLKPQMHMDINTGFTKVDDTHYEVDLRLTVTVKQDEETVFLVEVKQAGLFLISNVEGEQLNQVLRSVCPNLLFPYARETVDALAIKGSFPPVMLQPVNFEALYQQALRQQQEQPAEQQTH